MINNKNYIGQTMAPDKRWYEHRRASANPKQIIAKAIHKYGAHNFTFDLIACTKTVENADLLEIELIIQYESHVATNRGYNASTGGGNKNAGAKKTAEEIERMKAKMIGKHFSPSTEFKSGQVGTYGMLGKTHPDEWKKAASERMKGNLDCGKNTKGKTWKVVNGKRVWMEKVGSPSL